MFRKKISVVSIVISTLFFIISFASQPLYAQHTPPSAPTATSVTDAADLGGGLFSVAPASFSGNGLYGFKSFDNFDVIHGNTLRMLFPSANPSMKYFIAGINNNIYGMRVWGRVVGWNQTNGAVGGHLIFLSPYGIYTGPGSVIAADALTLTTANNMRIGSLANIGIISPDAGFSTNSLPSFDSDVITFSGINSSVGQIYNQGQLITLSHTNTDYSGELSIALIGKNIINTGRIGQISSATDINFTDDDGSGVISGYERTNNIDILTGDTVESVYGNYVSTSPITAGGQGFFTYYNNSSLGFQPYIRGHNINIFTNSTGAYDAALSTTPSSAINIEGLVEATDINSSGGKISLQSGYAGGGNQAAGDVYIGNGGRLVAGGDPAGTVTAPDANISVVADNIYLDSYALSGQPIIRAAGNIFMKNSSPAGSLVLQKSGTGTITPEIRANHIYGNSTQDLELHSVFLNGAGSSSQVILRADGAGDADNGLIVDGMSGYLSKIFANNILLYSERDMNIGNYGNISGDNIYLISHEKPAQMDLWANLTVSGTVSAKDFLYADFRRLVLDNNSYLNTTSSTGNIQFGSNNSTHASLFSSFDDNFGILSSIQPATPYSKKINFDWVSSYNHSPIRTNGGNVTINSQAGLDITGMGVNSGIPNIYSGNIFVNSHGQTNIQNVNFLAFKTMDIFSQGDLYVNSPSGDQNKLFVATANGNLVLNSNGRVNLSNTNLLYNGTGGGPNNAAIYGDHGVYFGAYNNINSYNGNLYLGAANGPILINSNLPISNVTNLTVFGNMLIVDNANITASNVNLAVDNMDILNNGFINASGGNIRWGDLNSSSTPLNMMGTTIVNRYLSLSANPGDKFYNNAHNADMIVYVNNSSNPFRLVNGANNVIFHSNNNYDVYFKIRSDNNDSTLSNFVGSVGGNLNIFANMDSLRTFTFANTYGSNITAGKNLYIDTKGGKTVLDNINLNSTYGNIGIAGDAGVNVGSGTEFNFGTSNPYGHLGIFSNGDINYNPGFPSTVQGNIYLFANNLHMSLPLFANKDIYADAKSYNLTSSSLYSYGGNITIGNLPTGAGADSVGSIFNGASFTNADRYRNQNHTGNRNIILDAFSSIESNRDIFFNSSGSVDIVGAGTPELRADNIYGNIQGGFNFSNVLINATGSGNSGNIALAADQDIGFNNTSFKGNNLGLGSRYGNVNIDTYNNFDLAGNLYSYANDSININQTIELPGQNMYFASREFNLGGILTNITASGIYFLNGLGSINTLDSGNSLNSAFDPKFANEFDNLAQTGNVTINLNSGQPNQLISNSIYMYNPNNGIYVNISSVATGININNLNATSGDFYLNSNNGLRINNSTVNAGEIDVKSANWANLTDVSFNATAGGVDINSANYLSMTNATVVANGNIFVDSNSTVTLSNVSFNATAGDIGMMANQDIDVQGRFDAFDDIGIASISDAGIASNVTVHDSSWLSAKDNLYMFGNVISVQSSELEATNNMFLKFNNLLLDYSSIAPVDLTYDLHVYLGYVPPSIDGNSINNHFTDVPTKMNLIAGVQNNNLSIVLDNGANIQAKDVDFYTNNNLSIQGSGFGDDIFTSGNITSKVLGNAFINRTTLNAGDNIVLNINGNFSVGGLTSQDRTTFDSGEIYINSTGKVITHYANFITKDTGLGNIFISGDKGVTFNAVSTITNNNATPGVGKLALFSSNGNVISNATIGALSNISNIYLYGDNIDLHSNINAGNEAYLVFNNLHLYNNGTITAGNIIIEPNLPGSNFNWITDQGLRDRFIPILQDRVGVDTNIRLENGAANAGLSSTTGGIFINSNGGLYLNSIATSNLLDINANDDIMIFSNGTTDISKSNLVSSIGDIDIKNNVGDLSFNGTFANSVNGNVFAGSVDASSTTYLNDTDFRAGNALGIFSRGNLFLGDSVDQTAYLGAGNNIFVDSDGITTLHNATLDGAYGAGPGNIALSGDQGLIVSSNVTVNQHPNSGHFAVFSNAGSISIDTDINAGGNFYFYGNNAGTPNYIYSNILARNDAFMIFNDLVLAGSGRVYANNITIDSNIPGGHFDDWIPVDIPLRSKVNDILGGNRTGGNTVITLNTNPAVGDSLTAINGNIFINSQGTFAMRTPTVGTSEAISATGDIEIISNNTANISDVGIYAGVGRNVDIDSQNGSLYLTNSTVSATSGSAMLDANNTLELNNSGLFASDIILDGGSIIASGDLNTINANDNLGLFGGGTFYNTTINVVNNLFANGSGYEFYNTGVTIGNATHVGNAYLATDTLRMHNSSSIYSYGNITLGDIAYNTASPDVVETDFIGAPYKPNGLYGRTILLDNTSSVPIIAEGSISLNNPLNNFIISGQNLVSIPTISGNNGISVNSSGLDVAHVSLQSLGNITVRATYDGIHTHDINIFGIDTATKSSLTASNIFIDTDLPVIFSNTSLSAGLGDIVVSADNILHNPTAIDIQSGTSFYANNLGLFSNYGGININSEISTIGNNLYFFANNISATESLINARVRAAHSIYLTDDNLNLGNNGWLQANDIFITPSMDTNWIKDSVLQTKYSGLIDRTGGNVFIDIANSLGSNIEATNNLNIYSNGSLRMQTYDGSLANIRGANISIESGGVGTSVLANISLIGQSSGNIYINKTNISGGLDLSSVAISGAQNIFVNSAGATDISTGSMSADQDISVISGGDLTTGTSNSLGLSAGDIYLDSAGMTDISNTTFTTTSGPLVLNGDTGLTVGTGNNFTGITGNIGLFSTSGNISVSSDIESKQNLYFFANGGGTSELYGNLSANDNLYMTFDTLDLESGGIIHAGNSGTGNLYIGTPDSMGLSIDLVSMADNPLIEKLSNAFDNYSGRDTGININYTPSASEPRIYAPSGINIVSDGNLTIYSEGSYEIYSNNISLSSSGSGESLIDTVRFNADGGTLRIDQKNSSGSLRLSSGVSVVGATNSMYLNSAGSLTANGVSMSVSDLADIRSSDYMTIGNGALIVGGDIDINSGGPLTIDSGTINSTNNDLVVNSSSDLNTGTTGIVTLIGNGMYLNAAGSATFSNTVFETGTNNPLVLRGNTGLGIGTSNDFGNVTGDIGLFSNNGSINVNSDLTAVGNLDLFANGTGTSYINSNLTADNYININSNGTLNINGGGIDRFQANAININATGSGNNSIQDILLNANGGDLRISMTNSTGNLGLSGVSTANLNNMYINSVGSLNVNSGNMSVLNLADIRSSNGLTIGNGAIINGGDIDINSVGPLIVNSGTINSTNSDLVINSSSDITTGTVGTVNLLGNGIYLNAVGDASLSRTDFSTRSNNPLVLSGDSGLLLGAGNVYNNVSGNIGLFSTNDTITVNSDISTPSDFYLFANGASNVYNNITAGNNMYLTFDSLNLGSGVALHAGNLATGGLYITPPDKSNLDNYLSWMPSSLLKDKISNALNNYSDRNISIFGSSGSGLLANTIKIVSAGTGYTSITNLNLNANSGDVYINATSSTGNLNLNNLSSININNIYLNSSGDLNINGSTLNANREINAYAMNNITTQRFGTSDVSLNAGNIYLDSENRTVLGNTTLNINGVLGNIVLNGDRGLDVNAGTSITQNRGNLGLFSNSGSIRVNSNLNAGDNIYFIGENGTNEINGTLTANNIYMMFDRLDLSGRLIANAYHTDAGPDAGVVKIMSRPQAGADFSWIDDDSLRSKLNTASQSHSAAITELNISNSNALGAMAVNTAYNPPINITNTGVIDINVSTPLLINGTGGNSVLAAREFHINGTGTADSNVSNIHFNTTGVAGNPRGNLEIRNDSGNLNISNVTSTNNSDNITLNSGNVLSLTNANLNAYNNVTLVGDRGVKIDSDTSQFSKNSIQSSAGLMNITSSQGSVLVNYTDLNAAKDILLVGRSGINIDGASSSLPTTLTAHTISLNSAGGNISMQNSTFAPTGGNLDIRANNNITINNNVIVDNQPPTGNIGLFSKAGNINIYSNINAGKNLYTYSNILTVNNNATVSANNNLYMAFDTLNFNNGALFSNSSTGGIYLGYLPTNNTDLNSLSNNFNNPYLAAFMTPVDNTLSINTAGNAGSGKIIAGSDGTIHIGNPNDTTASTYSNITINSKIYTNGTELSSSLLPSGMSANKVAIYLPKTPPPTTLPDIVVIPDTNATVNPDTGTFTDSNGTKVNVDETIKIAVGNAGSLTGGGNIGGGILTGDISGNAGGNTGFGSGSSSGSSGSSSGPSSSGSSPSSPIVSNTPGPGSSIPVVQPGVDFDFEDASGTTDIAGSGSSQTGSTATGNTGSTTSSTTTSDGDTASSTTTSDSDTTSSTDSVSSENPSGNTENESGILPVSDKKSDSDVRKPDGENSDNDNASNNNGNGNGNSDDKDKVNKGKDKQDKVDKDKNDKERSDKSDKKDKDNNKDKSKQNADAQSSGQSVFGIDKKVIQNSYGSFFLESMLTNNSKENEFTADHEGVMSAAKAGYHPAGLEGFLMSLKMLEDISKAKSGQTNNTPVNSVFSYRHPATSLRIKQVDEEINALKSGNTDIPNNIFRARYNQVISTIKK